MKTQVIQLDVHDDIISVRDRMSWTKAPRLLLVFPRRGRLLARTLDLRLLQRHAAGLGAQLAVVARSPEVRAAAGELDIPVFETSMTAQRKVWPVGEKPLSWQPRPPRRDLRQARQAAIPAEGRWRSLPAVRLGFFSLAVLSVLVLLVLFIPSATIKMSPRLQTQSLILPVSASLDIKTVNLVAGSLPAHTASLVIAGSKTAPASGAAPLPDGPAKGLVRFRNLTASVVGIPSGTVVQTTGSPAVQFATTTDGVVAAGVGKTVDVPVQALENGTGGNLPAGQLIALLGSLGTSLSVTNPDPTGGGTDRLTPLPTAGDRLQLHDALLGELRQKALLQLPGTLSPSDVLFPGSLAVEQVLEETYIPAAGQPGDQLTLTLQVEFQVQYAGEEDLQSLAGAVMNVDLPAGYLPAQPAATLTSRNTPVTGADGVSRWEILAVRPLLARIDGQQAAQLVQGLKVKAAGQKLVARLPLSGSPEISLFPSWWPWLPWLSFRIGTVTK